MSHNSILILRVFVVLILRADRFYLGATPLTTISETDLEALGCILHLHTMQLTKQGVFLLTLAAGIEAVRTIIPTTSFNSQSDFDTDWNYNYPWGTDQ